MPAGGRPALLAAAAALALLAAAPQASAAAPKHTARLVAKVKAPVYVTSPPTGRRLFVVQRMGRIRIVRRGKLLRRPFLDIDSRVLATQQRGLLSMAFAPDYGRSGRFYVMYVANDDTVRVDELRRSRKHPNRAAPRTRRQVLNIGRGGDFHHGGQLQFGPDRLLYVSTGVTDRPHLAQDLGDLHGKLLRIDPRRRGGRQYTVPPGNPFAFTAGARPEIWASGLRNPWRFSFDRRNGAIAIGDVGEDSYEEIDFLPRGRQAGANFGYDVIEGHHQMRPGPVPPRYVAPVLVRPHGSSRAPACAVMGGYVVRDRSLRGLYGRYVYNDQCSPTLRTAVLRPGRARGDRPLRLRRRIEFAISFGEDSRGRVYAVSYYGEIWRLAMARKRRPR